MKRLTAAAVSLIASILLCIVSCAQDASFTLSESTLGQLGCDKLVYMPEQQIYHFTGPGSATVEIPAYEGLYVRVIAGGYRSESSGVTDNGVNCVCTVETECIYEDGKVSSLAGTAMIPADGTFHCQDIGTDTMFAGLPEDVERIRLTITGLNDTAYLKTVCVRSDDTQSRNMSDNIWHHNNVGNINAQTSRADHFILIGFVCAVALIMMIVTKVRQKYRKGI